MSPNLPEQTEEKELESSSVISIRHLHGTKYIPCGTIQCTRGQCGTLQRSACRIYEVTGVLRECMPVLRTLIIRGIRTATHYLNNDMILRAITAT